MGCVLYADDMLLLSASCSGVTQMVNVCIKYAKLWDISFNAVKSHCELFALYVLALPELNWTMLS